MRTRPVILLVVASGCSGAPPEETTNPVTGTLAPATETAGKLLDGARDAADPPPDGGLPQPPEGPPSRTSGKASLGQLQEQVVSPAALEKLQLAARASGSDPCGRACDGKDPESYWIYGPGGPSNWYKCSWDAITVRTIHPGPYPGDPWVELRYSPRCRTTWARGCCYANYAVRSYFKNGRYREVAYARGLNSSTKVYSAMLDDHNLLNEACVDFQIGGSPLWKCTGRY
jgi:hypothetical protein